MADNEKDIEQFRSMIEQSSRGVVFTGAGISTESGIPDYRSPGGIWTEFQPIDFNDFMASEEMRRESWRRKMAADAVMKQARPNKGHLAVGKLAQTGKVSTVITQNIDGLHQLSGVPDEDVIELHGNATYASCLECGKRYELEDIYEIFKNNETLPICDECGGIIKTATISFGQSMPLAEMQAAEEETLACDLFIAIGSSLVVYPAAGFPDLAKRNGARLIILNRDPTPLDGIADLVLNTEIGPTLSAAVDLD
ncbi:MAG: Sir2 family NAD-dependent protein deacetylase [Deltaproteobacteria bacterium]|nr:Sir2 family NAD-dependent protein deacetylase [Deltaproteobacteria bacterium]